ncbi:MAG: glycine cleavage system aminomethyltransferase GcvT [Flammeovirgaceae bacterium]
MPKRIPLHDLHVQLGAKMVDFAGYEMPVRYSSDIEEHKTVREGVGVFDVSHMGEFIIKGKGALPLIQKVTTNDASKLTIGKAQYSCLTNDKGGIVDDLIVYQLSEEEYMMVVNASNIEKDWNWIKSHNSFGAEMQNISEDTCLFAVQGALAERTLQKLTDIQLNQIPYYAFAKGKLAGIEMIISATGYTGAGGFELYVPQKHALEVWNQIFQAGKPFNIKPIGLAARDTLRLEMGFCLYGNDIDDNTSPLEAGLGWITKFNKDFIAANLLKKQKEEGLKRKLIGLVMIDKGVPRSHYELCNLEGSKIGEITSGTISPMLGYGIALAYVETKYAKEETEIMVNVRGKLLKAKVVKTPFWHKKV